MTLSQPRDSAPNPVTGVGTTIAPSRPRDSAPNPVTGGRTTIALVRSRDSSRSISLRHGRRCGYDSWSASATGRARCL